MSINNIADDKRVSIYQKYYHDYINFKSLRLNIFSIRVECIYENVILLLATPFSCKVIMALMEKNLSFDLEIEKTWERRTEFLAMNPAGDLPLLVEQDGTTLSNSQVICEYLEEVYPEVNLIGHDPVQRAETRRLINWFDRKFNKEVTENLVGEKLMKAILNMGEPHGPSVRAGRANIHYHLDYIGFLVERREWLAGDSFSLADIAAASHLCAVDYLGDVPWEQHEIARGWYEKIRSRNGFAELFNEQVPDFDPSTVSYVKTAS